MKKTLNLFFLLGCLNLTFSQDACGQEIRVKTYDQIKSNIEEVLNLKINKYPPLMTAWQVASPVLPNQGYLKEVSEESIAGLLGVAISSCLIRFDLDSKMIPAQRWFYGLVTDMGASTAINLYEAKSVLEEMSLILIGRQLAESEIEILLNWDLLQDNKSNLSQREKYASFCALLLAAPDFMIRQ